MSSAEVIIKEVDLTTRVPSFPGVYGAMVLDAPRGLIGATLVTSETQLLERYTPNNKLEVGFTNAFTTAIAYLQKSDRLWIVRPDNTPQYGAVLVKRPAASGDPVLVPVVGGVEDPENYTYADDDLMLITGADQGEWNNDLAVSILPNENKEPDSFIIQVIKGGKALGLSGSIITSRKVDHHDGYNRNIYVENMSARNRWINIYDNPFAADQDNPDTTLASTGAPIFTQLTGGDNGDPVTTGMHMLAMDRFKGRDSYPVTLFMDGGHSVAPYQRHLIKICEKRQDSVALLSIPYEVEASTDYLNEIVGYVRDTLNAPSSFGAIYTPHLRIYDKHTDRYVYASPEGHVGAIISASADTQEIWYPPAGFRRGVLLVDDVLLRFSKGGSDGEMDYLYDNNINPIRFAQGRGIVVWGQKTLQTRPSSTDRLNVRLLLIVIEPAIAETLEYFLFEINDESTRKQIEVLIDSYMEGIKARRGVYDFMVKCDEENNTPEIIDSNRLVVHLFIKPTRSAEYIDFYVVLTPTGMTFNLAEDLVGGI